MSTPAVAHYDHSPAETVTFFMADAEGVARLQDVDPDIHWREFSTGRQIWIGQTFCRLKARGCRVALTAAIPIGGTIVAHHDDVAALIEANSDRCGMTIISTRADRRDASAADQEIVQNQHSADGVRRIFIPHWPQPGLIPRSAARSEGIETIAFKGSRSEIAPELREPTWERQLAAYGIAWQRDSAKWRGNAAVYDEVAWNDYSAIDVVVGLRKAKRHLFANKPASKLVNAWRAGVPAILGPEIAYRELRRSPLDYIEVRDADELLAAILRLRSDPALYRAMIANGAMRAADFTVAAVADRWENLLFGPHATAPGGNVVTAASPAAAS